MNQPRYPSEEAQRFLLRFEHSNHRDRLKELAARSRRSLNKQILHLIEQGERMERIQGGVQ